MIVRPHVRSRGCQESEVFEDHDLYSTPRITAQVAQQQVNLNTTNAHLQIITAVEFNNYQIHVKDLIFVTIS